MSRKREGAKCVAGGLTAASFDIFSLRGCNSGSSSRDTKKGLAGLEGMIALPEACSKIPVALFGTPLRGAVKRAEGNPP
jgi:hypothetical protein